MVVVSLNSLCCGISLQACLVDVILSVGLDLVFSLLESILNLILLVLIGVLILQLLVLDLLRGRRLGSCIVELVLVNTLSLTDHLNLIVVDIYHLVIGTTVNKHYALLLN